MFPASRTAAGTTHVTRLICASISRVPGSVMDVLLSLREEARELPAETPVRAALLYTCGWFVLWLEGSEGAVEKVRARAEADARNTRQILLHRSQGPSTLTEAFSLATLQVRDTPAAFGRRIFAARDQEADSDPARLWDVLCAPCTVPGQDWLARPGRRVGLVASDDPGPVDLLRRAGEAAGSAVAYQRITDSSRRSGDVGIAYVDLPTEAAPRRVALLARRALSHALVRQSLEGFDELVLLLGARDDNALALADAVADCLQTLSGPAPDVLLVAEQASVGAAVARRLAQRCVCAQRPAVVEIDPETLPRLIAGEPVRTRPAGAAAHTQSFAPRAHSAMEMQAC